MADTVRFMTWNDTVTPANSSGANGFPTPFIAGGGSFPYATAMTFDEAIKLFWRVKEWSLSTDGAVTASGITTTLPNGVLTGGAVQDGGFVMTSEIQHVNQALSGPGVQCTKDATSANGDSHASFGFFIDGVTNAPVVHTTGGNFYPPFFVGGVTRTASGEPIAADLAVTNDPGGTPKGSITATIDGIPFTLYYDYVLDPGASFTLTHFDLTPASYWPYAALADGTPIYNTSTGAQLQAPTN